MARRGKPIKATSESDRLRLQIASLEQLLTVQERVVLEQARHLEDALATLDARAQELARTNEALRAEIVERQNAEKAAHALAERWEAIMCSAHDAIVSADHRGLITSWNSGAEKLFGYREAEIVGQPLTRLMPERFREAHIAGVARVAAGGEMHVVGKVLELCGLRRDNTEFPLELSVSKWSTAEGVFFTGIIRDISERHRAAAAVSRSETKYRTLFDTSRDAVMLLDEKGFFDCNDATLAIFGCATREEFCSKHPGEVSPPKQPCGTDSITLANQRIATAMENGTNHFEWMHKRLDTGALFPADVLLSRMELEGKTVLQAVVRDITERIRAENQLKAKTAELERSNKALQDFAHVASHDLQEPLRKIQAFGDRLKSKSEAVLSEEARDYLARMLNAAGRMQTLINDLLTYSRVSTRGQPFQPVSLSVIVQDVLTDLEVRVEQSGGRVEVDALPTIDADPTQMRQLFQNLIGNALKFRRKDEAPVVKVHAVLVDSTEGMMVPGGADSGYCEITVEDNGIGFDPKHADRIFGIFQRLHGRGEYEGTGVGLAVCRKIVERHGGTIVARGEPGKGATFTISLPRHHESTEEDSA